MAPSSVFAATGGGDGTNRVVGGAVLGVVPGVLLGVVPGVVPGVDFGGVVEVAVGPSMIVPGELPTVVPGVVPGTIVVEPGPDATDDVLEQPATANRPPTATEAMRATTRARRAGSALPVRTVSAGREDHEGRGDLEGRRGSGASGVGVGSDAVMADGRSLTGGRFRIGAGRLSQPRRGDPEVDRASSRPL